MTGKQVTLVLGKTCFADTFWRLRRLTKKSIQSSSDWSSLSCNETHLPWHEWPLKSGMMVPTPTGPKGSLNDLLEMKIINILCCDRRSHKLKGSWRIWCEGSLPRSWKQHLREYHFVRLTELILEIDLVVCSGLVLYLIYYVFFCCFSL